MSAESVTKQRSFASKLSNGMHRMLSNVKADNAS